MLQIRRMDAQAKKGTGRFELGEGVIPSQAGYPSPRAANAVNERSRANLFAASEIDNAGQPRRIFHSRVGGGAFCFFPEEPGRRDKSAGPEPGLLELGVCGFDS